MTKNHGDKSELTSFSSEKATSKTALAIYLGGLAPSGRRSMYSLLNHCAEILAFDSSADDFDWKRLRYVHVAKVRATLLDKGYATSTINMTLAALKGIAQTAFNLQLLDADSLARIRTVKRVKGDSYRKGRALSKDEIKRLIQAAKQHPQKIHQQRDKAIILTLCGAGLRVGELVALRINDYCIVTQTLTIRRGKGRKYREITVAPVVARALCCWLKANTGSDALFTHIHRYGQPGQKALTEAGSPVFCDSWVIWLAYSHSRPMTYAEPSLLACWSRALISTLCVSWQGIVISARRCCMTGVAIILSELLLLVCVFNIFS